MPCLITTPYRFKRLGNLVYRYDCSGNLPHSSHCITCRVNLFKKRSLDSAIRISLRKNRLPLWKAIKIKWWHLRKLSSCVDKAWTSKRHDYRKYFFVKKISLVPETSLCTCTLKILWKYGLQRWLFQNLLNASIGFELHLVCRDDCRNLSKVSADESNGINIFSGNAPLSPRYPCHRNTPPPRYNPLCTLRVMKICFASMTFYKLSTSSTG